jgi:hypothetical protein
MPLDRGARFPGPPIRQDRGSLARLDANFRVSAFTEPVLRRGQAGSSFGRSITVDKLARMTDRQSLLTLLFTFAMVGCVYVAALRLGG